MWVYAVYGVDYGLGAEEEHVIGEARTVQHEVLEAGVHLEAAITTIFMNQINNNG